MHASLRRVQGKGTPVASVGPTFSGEQSIRRLTTRFSEPKPLKKEEFCEPDTGGAAEGGGREGRKGELNPKFTTSKGANTPWARALSMHARQVGH